MFVVVIMTLIVINCVVLALDRFGMDEQEVKRNDAINIVFSVIFLFEMLIKILGMGIQDYCRD